MNTVQRRTAGLSPATSGRQSGSLPAQRSVPDPGTSGRRQPIRCGSSRTPGRSRSLAPSTA